MRSLIRILTLGMMTLLVFGTASAAGPGVDVALSGATDHASADAGALVDGDARYSDVDVTAAGEELSGALDTDANVADVESAASGGLFAWLEVRLSAVAEKVSALFAKLGHDAPETDGAAEVYASDDGIDLDASVAGKSFDESPLGDLDGKTFEGAATAKGKVEEVKAKLPTVG